MAKDIPQINPDSALNSSEPRVEKTSDTITKDIAVEPKMNESQGGGSKKKKFKFKKPSKKVLITAGAIFLIILLLVAIPMINFYRNMKKLQIAGERLVNVAQQQDLVLVRQELENTQKALDGVEKSYTLISWTKLVPFFGKYSKDLDHLLKAGRHGFDAAFVLVETIEPYSDIIGFKNGEESTSGEETAVDRIDFVTKSLPVIIPKIDELAEKMVLVQEELEYINPSDYPETLAGQNVRSNLEKGLTLVDQSTDFVVNGKMLIEKAPDILGINGEREYLVLFQNDKELRPTGGFMTAYSLMGVKDAKFEPSISSDIYDLDVKYQPSIKAPGPIIDYIKGPYIISQNLRLRDMNWSPDFGESMKLFTEEAESIGLKGYDGIIAVDTQLLVNLLDVLGPIGVSGFGNFSTEIIPECNCPQVIYELESFADVEGPIIWSPTTGEIILRPPNSDNRKRIIGPLMNSIMANTLGQPKEKIPELVEAGFKSLNEKHVLLYMFDEEEQEAVEKFGIAGKIEEYDGDYLHINDANLGGRKSNMYVTQEVDQNIEVARDGTVTKTVEITYNNPEKQDGWLNSVLPNWVRIYVPKGSELVDFSGVEDTEEPYEEFGKTVYAGFFELRPQGVAKVSLTYTLPFKVDKTYNLLIQKQPGTDSPLYTVNMGNNTEEFYLKEDKELKLSR